MTPDVLSRVMEATWPAAAVRAAGPFILREGDGGGQRVSAASVTGAFSEADLQAVTEQPLFVIYPGRDPAEDALDAALAARGYAVHDPVLVYAAPVSDLVGEVPFLSAFPHWPPLETAKAIWAEGGIGPGRLRVMERAEGPKTVILARSGDRPAGAAFVACDQGVAMVHAVEVRAAQRRKGAGGHLLRAAANWAADQGAGTLALAVTARNLAARALYDRAGLQVVGQYHYRRK